MRAFIVNLAETIQEVNFDAIRDGTLSFCDNSDFLSLVSIYRFCCETITFWGAPLFRRIYIAPEPIIEINDWGNNNSTSN